MAGAIDKSPAVKKESSEEIRKVITDYDPNSSPFKPTKVLGACTQITARLIR